VAFWQASRIGGPHADPVAQERHDDACHTAGDPAAHGTEGELAQRFGVGKFTIRKWRKRSTVEDGSHTPHRLQTTLNAAQEEIVVYLRRHLRLSLDDLLAVVREFIEPSMSRSALDRLLRRRGVNRLPEPEVTATQVKSFKAYEPGYVHVDGKYLP
jgi:transposase